MRYGAALTACWCVVFAGLLWFVLAMASLFLVFALAPLKGPERLPDPGRHPQRSAPWLDQGLAAATGREPESILVSVRQQDVGPFMNTVLHRAEAAGGYVAERHYYMDAFEPSHYDYLALMVPASFREGLAPLRDGEGSHLNAHYRQWALERPPAASAPEVGLPPVADDLAPVVVRARYRGTPTPRMEKTTVYLMVSGAAALVLAGLACGVGSLIDRLGNRQQATGGSGIP